MKRELLTLALTETRPGTGEFTVLAVDREKGIIVSLLMSKNEIIDNYGNVFFDIGSYTCAEIEPSSLPNTNPNNKMYKIISSSKAQLCNISTLKECLFDQLRGPSFETFQINQKMKFCVVKVSKIDGFTINRISDEVLKCHMDVFIYPDNQKVHILNKDYRWLNYWAHVPEEEIEDNIARYVSLLNSKGKSLYLIIYRHYFKNKQNIWISGMHWL